MMSIHLIKKLSVVLLSSSVLVACTAPPKRDAPLSAEQLAQTQLQPRFPVVNQTPVSFPIAEMPPTQSRSLKEVNQKGGVPLVTTLTDSTLKMSDITKLSDDDPIELNFEQMPLQQIFQLMSDALGISMVIDPSIGDKVTIRTSKEKPLRKKDLWPLLQLLLNDAGIVMQKKAGVYHLKKIASQLPGTIGINPERLTSSTSSQVLQITPLRYISAESAQSVLNPMVQPKGRVTVLPSMNIIGITTTPQQLKRINKLLRIVDADPFLHRGMRLFRLINSKAVDVQTDLDKILKALYGTAPSTFQVIALERINAILVIAPPNTGFNEVALWVDILDERSEESGDQVFIYHVKNLEASKLASTLENVFKIEDKKAAEEKEKLKHNEESKKDAKGKEDKAPPSRAGRIAVSADLNVTIVADESTNSLLIRATPRDYRQLLETIYALDRVPKEVMVNVVMAEVTLTKANRFGIDWQYFFGSGKQNYVRSDFNVPAQSFSTTTDSTNTTTSSSNSLVGLVIGNVTGSVNAILNTIASTNDISILSRPSLLVRDNEEASINVGSNEPFLGSLNRSSINTSNLVSQDVQYKDTGITVKVTPRINEDGIINMKIFQELSQLGPTRTTQNLQSFIQRKLETSVVVRDGNAIVIGGMIETRQKNDEQSLPGLRDIPLIGSLLFASTDHEEVRTELVLIIVPQIVNPEADNRPLVQKFRQNMQLVSQLLNEQSLFMDDLRETPPETPETPEPVQPVTQSFR
ncbi:MAG: type II secretion system protein GspD [Candidatus Parabeggiatoa sp. nov. 3]|nr:MAG: type II secretion system protein GspD [Gammaproteobacteria bacterium]RKZ65954.1 MAG: type II secretion system protein GspD [Gammaproteobacteria bacterium]